MKIVRLEATEMELSDPSFAGWRSLAALEVPLVPTPLFGNPLVIKISPFIAKSTDHGTLLSAKLKCAHNGSRIFIYLSWKSSKNDEIADLDQFVDGAAVMFPLSEGSSATTMGSEEHPVNAWYWKANLKKEAFDVIARGYGTSQRLKDERLPIKANASYENGRWELVLNREMTSALSRAEFMVGGETKMAFAFWDGSNRERSGRKSFSGEFQTFEIEA